MNTRPIAAWLAAALVPAAPALAGDDAPRSVFDGDHLTIGAGVVSNSSYDGSDDQVLSPMPAVQGRLLGVAISPRRGGVALDLVPDAGDARIGFSFGPMASVSFNRNRQINDPVVKLAGKLDPAIELGVNAGVTAYRLLSSYDALTLSADVKRDINGAYKGTTWSPSISYLTPLSKAVLVSVSARAHHADGRYARYYYSVTGAQAAVSGLPQFAAKAGWDSIGGGVLAAWDTSGDLRDGGFALFAIGGYTRMLGDAKRTPYTAIRGDADQWIAGAGLAYTF